MKYSQNRVMIVFRILHSINLSQPVEMVQNVANNRTEKKPSGTNCNVTGSLKPDGPWKINNKASL